MAKSIVRSRAPKAPAPADPNASLADKDAEIASLRRQLATAGARPSADPVEVEEYPRAMYRKHAVDLKHPHGYEVRRIASAEDQARLPKGWVESPADL